jgi:hypothetical protein
MFPDVLARRRADRRVRCFLLLVAAAVGLGCAGPNGVRDCVSGTVTLNGQPVEGMIVFITGGEETLAPLVNGLYKIDNPPKGEVDIVIRGMEESAPLAPPRDAAAVAAGSTGAAPPARYAAPGAIPRFKVTGGRQKLDLTLTP